MSLLAPARGRHRRPSAITPRRVGAAAVATVISSSTVVALTPSQAAAAPTVRATAAFRALSYGQRSASVRWVQTVLRVSPRSGYFGPKTRAAVRTFQRRKGLRVTGVVDARTWVYLKRYAAQRSRAAARTSAPRVTGLAARNARIIRVAASLRGIPYRYGGTTTRGFDCSGYTGYVYKKAAGITLPRTSRAQGASVRRVSRSAAMPGDLIFFYNSSGRIYHTGIYAGGGTLWSSSRPGVPVKKAKIWTSSYFIGRR